MEIIWSPTAKKSFYSLVDFLETKWEAKVITRLFTEVESSLKLISSNPSLFPIISDKKQIRKCVIRKRTLLMYTVDEKNKRVILIQFIDGRVNPLKYTF